MNKNNNIALAIVMAMSVLLMGASPALAQNPIPTITSISPSSVPAGTGSMTLTVFGSGFIPTSFVQIDGNSRSTTYVSSAELSTTILSSDVSSSGSHQITVVNSGPGGGTSNSATFTVTSNQNPVPFVSNISPSSIAVGSAGFTLTVNGNSFASNAMVNFNGSSRNTTFVSSSQLTASIAAADVDSTGNFNITVTNPGPGGGTSNTVTLAVVSSTGNNPFPSITTISPTSAFRGTNGLTLTVNGSNFIPSSVVRFNGIIRPTTYVSSTQLTSAIPAVSLATAGLFMIEVTNPAPGGGTSNMVPFNVVGLGTPTTPTTPNLPNTGFGPQGLNIGMIIASILLAGISLVGWRLSRKAV